jgi:hypothetical protein
VLGDRTLTQAEMARMILCEKTIQATTLFDKGSLADDPELAKYATYVMDRYKDYKNESG